MFSLARPARSLLHAVKRPKRPAAVATLPLRFFAASPSSLVRPSLALRSPADALPWFVDAEEAAPAPSEPPRLSTSPEPTPPPPHLLPALHPLHEHLSASPFFDRDGLTYINAREADPEGSWVDWVVLATLREGRERGIRGAAEGVRVFLAKQPLDLAPPADSSSGTAPPPFSPSAPSPVVSGLPPAPSKHARARTGKGGPAPTRADQATGWAMVDAGRVVVHVMTPEARGTYGRGVEEVWEVKEEPAARRAREEKEREDRERELEENMERARREMEEEDRIEAQKKAQAA
ncbi:hypothetical protein JCM10213_001826 [Rhodosporidiobolus nylandii]